jgi:hypothetical protein
MGFFDSIENAVSSAVSDVGHVIGGAVDGAENAVEGVASGIGSVASGAANFAGAVLDDTGKVVGGVANLAGGVVGGLLNGGASLFGIVPQLIGGLTGLVNPQQSQASVQTAPYPFSQAAASAVLADPAQFATNLNSAGSKLATGLSSPSLGGIDAGAIDQQIAGLQSAANTAIQNGDQLTAQQDMMQMQLLATTASTMMSDQANSDNKIIENSRLS